MAEELKLKQPTRTYFDAVGEIEFKQENFFPNQTGKNNPNYTYSRLSFYLKNNDQKIRISLMGGFTPQTKIYAMNDKKESMTIDFGDRDNEEIIKQVSSLSLFQVGLNKVDIPKTKMNEDKNELEVILKADGTPEMIKVWNFQNFLTEYDLINFLGQNIKNGQMVRITGEISYNIYEEKLQKNYKINKIYILTEEDTFEDRFNLKVETLVDKDSLNESEPIIQGDNECKIKINTKVFNQINKNERSIIPLDIFYVYKENEKETVHRIINKIFKVSGDTIRKVVLECSLFNGKVYSSLSEDAEIELSDEVQELIELGYCTREEALKKANPKGYSEVQFVDEIRFEKPFFIKKDGIISLSIDDDFYDKSDLINLKIVSDEKKGSNKISTNNLEENFDIDDDFLPF